MKNYIPALCIVMAIMIAPLSVAESKHGDRKTVTQDHDLTHHDTAYFAQPLAPMSCDELHPVTSKADLIRQLYGTALLNDCLYEMDIATLQSIWNIPVKDGYDSASWDLGAEAYADTTINVSLNLEVYKYESTNYFESEESGELVSEDVEMFQMTLLDSPFKTDSRNSEDLTLFPEGYFPAAFGKPVEAEEGDGSPQAWSLYSQRNPTQYYNLRDANRDDIKQGIIYYWLSPDGQQRMIAPTYPIGAVPSIFFNVINFDSMLFGAPGKK